MIESRKPGREAFNLLFDALGHIEGGAMRDMAVGPGGVFAIRGARRVEEAVLHEQHVGSFGMLSLPDDSLGFANLFQRAAEMHRSSAGHTLALSKELGCPMPSQV